MLYREKAQHKKNPRLKFILCLIGADDLDMMERQEWIQTNLSKWKFSAACPQGSDQWALLVGLPSVQFTSTSVIVFFGFLVMVLKRKPIPAAGVCAQMDDVVVAICSFLLDPFLFPFAVLTSPGFDNYKTAQIRTKDKHSRMTTSVCCRAILVQNGNRSVRIPEQTKG